MAKRGMSIDIVLRNSKSTQAFLVVAGLITLGFLYTQLASLWILLVLVICFCSLVFAIWLARWLLDQDEGTEAMQLVAGPIREGAHAFLRVQYGAIFKIALLVCLLLFFLFFFREPPKHRKPHMLLSPGPLALLTCMCFLVGAVFSGISGYVGMWVSVRANLRVASSAGRNKFDDALTIALRGGAFCGLVVVTLCILGISLLFALLEILLVSDLKSVTHIPHLLVGYSFGASLVALFAQLGGGIFTKAADVGADMGGKVESNTPGDAPRNPAVIADLVGDNVGDCAGRGADLFESISGEIIGAMILGADLASRADLPNPVSFMFFPVLIHAFDLIVSSAAVMIIRPRRHERGQDSEKGGDLFNWEDPLDTLKRGYMIAMLFAMMAMAMLARWMLYTPKVPSAWLHYFGCSVIGVATSFIFVEVTKYYTDYNYGPVQRIALASKTGHGTNVIQGMAVGLESTALPSIVISIAVVSSYWVGQTSGLIDSKGAPTGGMFGTAIATMGMLSTAVYVLAMDTFGPITDNAGGIVEMSNQPEYARDITDRLDAVGNVTKATTKGYSIGAAGLAAFLLFRAFLDVVAEYSAVPLLAVNIATPEVFVCGLLGSMLVFLFSSFAMAAVGKTACEVVTEVREQFMDRPGIMNYTEKPDYGKCVALVTQASLREMIKPGLLAITLPLVVGIVARVVGAQTGRPLLGVECVASFVMFATATGILLALFLNNAGGAWDNAKKYVETGAHGGKGSEAHKAAVTGDTVGDPFKDTAGPSIHVLIKLLATITLVMCPLFLNNP
eukprot:NODE_293_length_2477_cov_77.335745_g272_i0.p1 GENE.NODE_293_length_2477_cov_77.335745_g272_i0~~NODE_293_length_2477_cov_77.335745_g272_i0.p1  ORF type:complete len:787 (-),score=237.10 NODE_293_length_2477_cov_77.335745_g272_i0:110-2470(-)